MQTIEYSMEDREKMVAFLVEKLEEACKKITHNNLANFIEEKISGDIESMRTSDMALMVKKMGFDLESLTQE